MDSKSHATTATAAAPPPPPPASNNNNNTNNNNNNNNTNNNNNNNNMSTARLFVGQLNFDAAEFDIRQLFAFYGHVLHVNILRDDEGKSSGSAFVTYGSTAEADMAILSLHNRYNMGREKPLQVSYCRRSEQISDFGYQHAVELQKQNKSNPLPPQRAA